MSSQFEVRCVCVCMYVCMYVYRLQIIECYNTVNYLRTYTLLYVSSMYVCVEYLFLRTFILN